MRIKLEDLNGGNLNKRISIIAYKLGKDEDNIPVEVIDTEISKFAYVDNSSQKTQEFLINSGIATKKCMEFCIRYCDVAYTSKIRYNKELYNIVGIENLQEKNRFINITAEKVE